jgi:hypothetical protein
VSKRQADFICFCALLVTLNTTPTDGSWVRRFGAAFSATIATGLFLRLCWKDDA